MDELNADGALKFDVDGVAVELTKDDLLIDIAQKEGYVSQEDNRMTVVLDTNLTPGTGRGRLRIRDHQQDPDHA